MRFRQVMPTLNRKQAGFIVCDLVLVETDRVPRDLYGWSR